MTAEIRIVADERTRIQIASMRPRSNDRGNQSFSVEHADLFVASMRPRSNDRGNLIRFEESNYLLEGFNEAAI